MKKKNFFQKFVFKIEFHLSFLTIDFEPSQTEQNQKFFCQIWNVVFRFCCWFLITPIREYLKFTIIPQKDERKYIP